MGTEGGQILFQGSPQACAELPAANSRTGAYLAGKLSIIKNAPTKKPDNRWLIVQGATEHNLKNIEALKENKIETVKKVDLITWLIIS